MLMMKREVEGGKGLQRGDIIWRQELKNKLCLCACYNGTENGMIFE